MSSDDDLSNSSDVTVQNSLREMSSVDRRRQSHNLLRRNRRKKMRLSFRELQDLVPSVNHIKVYIVSREQNWNTNLILFFFFWLLIILSV